MIFLNSLRKPTPLKKELSPRLDDRLEGKFYDRDMMEPIATMPAPGQARGSKAAKQKGPIGPF